MLTGFKKTIGVILIAVAAGYAGANLHGRLSGSSAGAGFISDKNAKVQGVHFAGLKTSAPDGNPDFVQAAEATVHAVVHVKTFYENHNNYNGLQWDPWGGMFGNPYQ